ncbi:hypothetical protein [Luteolibacter sp. LG18]|uniref:hypothetical protein n=1 Tax=Luteolibacter sp. LG18 TaxID=2819286 RepID=UPI0030C6FA1C
MILAEAAAAPDSQLSGEWVLKMIGALFAGLALIVPALVGVHRHATTKERERHRNVTVQAPFPTVSVQANNPPHPSWDQHQALAARVDLIETAVEKLRTEQAAQFKEIITSGHEREKNITAAFNDKIDDVARDWHGRLDLIFLHFGIKTPSRKQ